MNDNAVIRTEVADRFRTVGRLGEHVAAGRMDLALALDTARRLLEVAEQHSREVPAS